jgi:mutual gliding-motility protein MglA
MLAKGIRRPADECRGPIRCLGSARAYCVARAGSPSGFPWRKGGKGLHGVTPCDRVGSLKEDTTVVVVSYSGKEINAKLVYYGAGLSGKTTNLEAIYEAVPEASRGKMVSMKTQSDRTLFFDLLPLDLGEIMGFRTRFLLYTVPGQVFYNATRKLVLKGADAIVFVADSEVGKMEENKDSLANLKANLAEYKLSLDETPWVIQYNKRDLPNVYTVEELDAELNPGGAVPSFEAVATQGKGVFETFRGISHLLMERVTKDLRRTPSSGSMPSSSSSSATPPPRPVVEAPAPRAIVPAPPLSPARTMDRETQEAQPVARGPEEFAPAYGRQLDLPDEIPPAKAAPPIVEKTPETRPVVLEIVPEPDRYFPPRPPVTAHDPALEPSRAAASPKVEATETQSIVVPITFPARGKSGEIVIRIVLQSQDS